MGLKPHEWLMRLILAGVVSGVCTVLAIFAVITVPVPVAPGVSAFYIAAAVYVPFALWFGIWGGPIAGWVSCFILGIYSGFPIWFSAFWSVADVIEGAVPLIAFRTFKADPDLRESASKAKSWAMYFIFGVFLASLLSALWGGYTLAWFLGLPPAAATIVFLGWFIGDVIVLTVIATPMLYFLTKPIKRSQVYIEGYI
jgi:hypothetical protein